MSSISSLGIVPNLCETFPLVQELNWRLNPFSGPVEELGDAPSGAYLAMTKEQVVFSFWRVKFWEIVYSFGPVNISNIVTITYPEYVEAFDFNFSFPFTEVARLSAGRNLSSEQGLVCRQFDDLFDSALPTVQDSDLNDLPLNISSTETNDDGTFDYSRSVVSRRFTINDFSAGQEAGFWEFDRGQVGDLYYYPFVVAFNINISSDSSDGLLFSESAEANNPPPEDAYAGTVTGTLPRIAARLTTFPLPNQSGPLTEHKVIFQFSSESDVIELPLYDIETDLTPLTNTGFNLEGFSGITIRPKEYWTYDLGDGNGPIYDGTTGAQLRGF
jgi:hypothetical protein